MSVLAGPGLGRGSVRGQHVGGLSALLQTVALTVHRQDVHVVCQPVQQSPSQSLRSEHIGPLVERQVGGHKHRAPLVSLAEDLEEQFRTGLRQGHEAQLVYDQQLQTGQPLLEVQQTSVVPSLH